MVISTVNGNFRLAQHRTKASLRLTKTKVVRIDTKITEKADIGFIPLFYDAYNEVKYWLMRQCRDLSTEWYSTDEVASLLTKELGFNVTSSQLAFVLYMHNIFQRHQGYTWTGTEFQLSRNEKLLLRQQPHITPWDIK